MKKHIAISLVILCVYSLVISPSFADLFEKGQQAYDKQQYQLSYKYMLSAARLGDYRANFALSNMYRRGHGVAINHHEANRWLHRFKQQFNDAMLHQQDYQKKSKIK